MLTGDQLVEKYHKIWDDFYGKTFDFSSSNNEKSLLDRGFVFQFDEDIHQPDILFLGINPSYNGGEMEKHFYKRKQAVGHYYFKSFQTIADALKVKYNREITWTHTDLLVFRETNQNYIRDVLFKNEDGRKFICAQLEIAKEIIEFVNPKIIVVSNTQVRQLLGYERWYNKAAEREENVWMDYHFKMDEKLGTPKLRSDNNPSFNPYTFFTSMLSGQRALDIGTKERLIWHLNFILTHLEKTNI